MNHFAEPSYWQLYQTLPKEIRIQADRKFAFLKQDAKHPSLHFKQVGLYWSVRISKNYRALAVKDGDEYIWFWIGNHAEYERLIK